MGQERNDDTISEKRLRHIGVGILAGMGIVSAMVVATGIGATAPAGAETVPQGGVSSASPTVADEDGSNSPSWVPNLFARRPVDMRLVVSGDFEEPRHYSLGPAADAPYVCYPSDDPQARDAQPSDKEAGASDARDAGADAEKQPFVPQTVTSERGAYSFEIPFGFRQVSPESDDPCVDMAIRNDELGVTICLGRDKPGKTAIQMCDEWRATAEYPAHTGARFAQAAPGGQHSGLMWCFLFNERTGIRHAAAGIRDDGSVLHAYILTAPWPGYERKGDPHVARWIVEFLSSVRPDGPLPEPTE